jgi:hypothetical protein
LTFAAPPEISSPVSLWGQGTRLGWDKDFDVQCIELFRSELFGQDDLQ